MRIAQAIAAAVLEQQPGAHIDVVDTYHTDYIARPFVWAANAYDGIVSVAPAAWGTIFHTGVHPPVMRLARLVGRHLTQPAALERLVTGQVPAGSVQRLAPPAPHPSTGTAPPVTHDGQARAPEVIVRVISDLGQLSALRHSAVRLPPIVTVISDLVTVPRAWFEDHTRLYVVPTEQAYHACRRLGVPGALLERSGYPIRSHLFCAGAPARPVRAASERLNVLVMGGSSGSGSILQHVTALQQAGLPLDLTVVCGKNDRLRRQLEARARADGHQVRLTVLGYTDRVPELMRAADLLITKAGPSTLYEAVVCGLPMIITSYLPGQEEGNRELFTQAGVALAAEHPSATAELVRQLAADPARRQQLANPELARETCLAAGRIARRILEFCA